MSSKFRQEKLLVFQRQRSCSSGKCFVYLWRWAQSVISGCARGGGGTEICLSRSRRGAYLFWVHRTTRGSLFQQSMCSLQSALSHGAQPRCRLFLIHISTPFQFATMRERQQHLKIILTSAWYTCFAYPSSDKRWVSFFFKSEFSSWLIMYTGA